MRGEDYFIKCPHCGDLYSPKTKLANCEFCGAHLPKSRYVCETSGKGAAAKVMGVENGVDPTRTEVKWRDDVGGWEVKALDKQVNGSHYKDMKIQPVEFITANQLGFLEGCVIKRMCRWKAKDGVADLKKAIHEIELLIELHNDQG